MVQKKFQMKSIRTQDEVRQAVRILANSFFVLNGVYKNLIPNEEALYPIFEIRVRQSMKKDLASGFILNGKMIGASCSYEFNDYLKLIATSYNSEYMGILKKYGTEVETPLQKIHPQIGQAIHGGSGAVLPQYANKGYTAWFAIQRLKSYQAKGYKMYYNKLLSVASYKLLKRLGAIQMKRVQFQQQQFKNEFYYLIKIDLTKKIPSYEEIMVQKKGFL